jgi:hypothetical protein
MTTISNYRKKGLKKRNFESALKSAFKSYYPDNLSVIPEAQQEELLEVTIHFLTKHLLLNKANLSNDEFVNMMEVIDRLTEQKERYLLTISSLNPEALEKAAQRMGRKAQSAVDKVV